MLLAKYKSDNRLRYHEMAEMFGVTSNKVFRWCKDGMFVDGEKGSLRVIKRTEPAEEVLAKEKKKRGRPVKA